VTAERPEPLLTVLTAAQFTGTALCSVMIVTRPAGWSRPAQGMITSTVILLTTGMCLYAAVRERRSRRMLISWSMLTLAHLGAAFAIGPLTGDLARAVPAGTGGIIAGGYFPVALAALFLLLREGTPRWLPGMWKDAVVVCLGVLAVGSLAASFVDPVPGAEASGDLVWYLAPLADIALLAVILSIAVLTNSRFGLAAWWVSCGLSVIALTDLFRLLLQQGAGPEPAPFQVARLVGFSLIGIGTRRAPRTASATGFRDHRRRGRAALRLGPLAWTACGLSAMVLAAGTVGVAVPAHSAALALGSLCAALVRLGYTLARLEGWPLLANATRTDELTGLANRQALSEALASNGAASGADPGAQRWSGWTDRVALLLVDLDSFRDINEVLGHDTGDRVLAEVGTRLRGALRSPQLIARLGGDEFAVVLPGAGQEAARKVAKALCAVLAEPVEIDGDRLHVRASVGIATCLIPSEEPEDLLRQADVALNRAKATGTALEVYDPARDRRTARRLKRIDELRSALERGDLEVFLQPQVDLSDGAIVGCEALARWRHPQDGVLLPDSFLPLAAQTGLMRPVAALVLDRALDACEEWWSRGHRIPVSVNLTPDDLRDPGLSRRIEELLTRHGLPAMALRIEITENVLVTDPQSASQLLQSWRQAGIAVAIDDFGTGYSSLGYLRDLPFDELKLDRSFVADLTRRTTTIIVRHTVSMAHGLGMRVVGEGVEDQATARALVDVGCDIGQGLFFGPAAAVETFLDHLERSRP
jgi:diguanylate cyclase (GGDEF)-like protein